MTRIYGAVSSISANPIEKKPLYHFYPGTLALTAGSWSCNFGCPWCQNWDVSKTPPADKGQYVPPEDFVRMAERAGCSGTSISFNEPTLSLEWSLDVFRLARYRGLYNTFVTNGYMTAESLTLLTDAGLGAMNVDIKGNAASVRTLCKGIDVEKVWKTCEIGQRNGVHLEITTLVIPGVNDGQQTLRSIAKRIVASLGPSCPWHVTRYHPDYRFAAPATPVATLEYAWEIGKGAGLQFVYVGNMPGHRYESTYCPRCGALLIGRAGLQIRSTALRGSQCPRCGEAIAGVWGV